MAQIPISDNDINYQLHRILIDWSVSLEHATEDGSCNSLSMIQAESQQAAPS